MTDRSTSGLIMGAITAMHHILTYCTTDRASSSTSRVCTFFANCRVIKMGVAKINNKY